MKIGLLFPPIYLPIEGTKLNPPLGIYLLQRVLEKRGMDAVIMESLKLARDCKSKDALNEIGFKENPYFVKMVREVDVLGLSCDSFNYGIGRYVIKNAKEINKDLKVIIGGVHGSIFDEYVLKTSGADVVIRGDGENTLLKVLLALDSGQSMEDIPGITYFDENDILKRNAEVDRQPVEEIVKNSDIDFSGINMAYYNALPIETSRGCPYNCVFCSVYYKKNWRALPKEFIKDRLVSLSRVSKNIIFVDDAFTIDTERALDILNFVQDSSIDFKLTFEARVNNLVKALILEAISPQKVAKIQIGVESGYPEGLERIRKKITLQQVREVCEKAAKHNISHKILASFIIGFPWESVKDCLKTYEFASSLTKDYGINTVINWWLPIPSELWRGMRQSSGLDASMYDDPEWVISDDVFTKMHPNITLKVKAKLNFLIMNTHR